MQRVLSGVQPTNNLHIGNYLGAIKNWVELQKNYECFYCVVDLHAITVKQDPALLKQNIINTAKAYLALGVDPKKSTIFVQSHIQEHVELAWILNTITKMAELERMTQFKDKSAQHKITNVGLFSYPILMAADILLYNTDKVPVGDDQVQHIELTRTLAQRFNSTFGKIFKTPEGLIEKEGARIMGLDDPTNKMSKSAESEYNYISLLDTPEKARKKIMKAVTDSGSDIKSGKDKPALTNLLGIYSLFSNISIKEIENKYKGKGYGDFKKDLAEEIVKFLENFQNKFNNISDKEIEKVLEDGAKKARENASKKLQEVKKLVGLS